MLTVSLFLKGFSMKLYDKKDSFLESVTHSDPHESLTVNPNIPRIETDEKSNISTVTLRTFRFDKNHGHRRYHNSWIKTDR